MRIPMEEALGCIDGTVRPLAPLKTTIRAALGQITSEAVTAEMSQPPFPRSPYDGYALRAIDSTGASRKNPVTLKVVGASYAGSPSGVTVRAGEAVRIMTGGMIPEGADCVLMQEKTDEGESEVKIYAGLRPRDNYCPVGEDFYKGEEIIPAGVRITAAVAAVAAEAGVTQLAAYPRPCLAVLSTGDELVPPGEPLPEGKIYNSNSSYLVSRLSELGISYFDIKQAGDELGALTAAIDRAAKITDFVITTGGVSAGRKDLVPASLEQLGAKIIFHGVAMKPGMPAALAIYKGKPILALSGNPFAAAVTFEIFGRQIISILATDPGLRPEIREAVLAQDFPKKRPCRRFVKAFLRDNRVYLPEAQGNGQLRAMIGADCLAELPAGEDPLSAGQVVKIYMLEANYYALQSF